MNDKKQEHMHEKLNFVPLPSNPAELTIEHVRLLFGGYWIATTAVLRQLAQLALKAEKKE